MHRRLGQGSSSACARTAARVVSHAAVTEAPWSSLPGSLAEQVGPAGSKRNHQRSQRAEPAGLRITPTPGELGGRSGRARNAKRVGSAARVRLCGVVEVGDPVQDGSGGWSDGGSGVAVGTSGWVKIAHGERTVWLFQPDRAVWLQRPGSDPSADVCDPDEADPVGRVVDAANVGSPSEPGGSFTALTGDGTPIRDPDGGLPLTYPSMLAAAAALADTAIGAGT